MGGRYKTAAGEVRYTDRMYRFEPATNKFELEPTSLRQPAYQGAAVIVDAGWLGCKNG